MGITVPAGDVGAVSPRHIGSHQALSETQSCGEVLCCLTAVGGYIGNTGDGIGLILQRKRSAVVRYKFFRIAIHGMAKNQQKWQYAEASAGAAVDVAVDMAEDMAAGAALDAAAVVGMGAAVAGVRGC